jgi:hypothetical protein
MPAFEVGTFVDVLEDLEVVDVLVHGDRVLQMAAPLEVVDVGEVDGLGDEVEQVDQFVGQVPHRHPLGGGLVANQSMPVSGLQVIEDRVAEVGECECHLLGPLKQIDIPANPRRQNHEPRSIGV